MSSHRKYDDFGPLTRAEIEDAGNRLALTDFMRRPIREFPCPLCLRPLIFNDRWLDYDYYRCTKCRGSFFRNASWEDVGEHVRIGRRWYGQWVLCVCGFNTNGGSGQNGAGQRWVAAGNEHAWHVHAGVHVKDCCACR